MAIVQLARLIPLERIAPPLRPAARDRCETAVMWPIERQYCVVVLARYRTTGKHGPPRTTVELLELFSK